ncbi:Putative tartrate transporter [Neomoorella glycerini]|uniref:Tartrate transporter n=1 Tax=Neomoorella glycerini TaxID=55779 RepID=A0A6I5ZNN3_9FIRM|nr:MFS transporter [Moorella glycerini]QGP91376.1 Putative tartrate transporter [Moorella glycerini]
MAAETVSMEKRVPNKVLWHILPLTILGMAVAYVDRTNISFAALQMNKDLGLSAAAYGLGAGLFFIGYFIFEVPSNMIMVKVGARVWLARIMITWGIVTIATGFVHNAATFYVLRFLLGAAEAGFFPGCLLYATYWTTQRERAFMSGSFLAGGQVGSLIGAPLAGWILSATHGAIGLPGWRWLFIIEGAMAVVMAIIFMSALDNRPEEAKWLEPEEKTWLLERLKADREAAGGPRQEHENLASALRLLWNPRFLFYSFVYFVCMLVSWGLVFWTPLVFKGVAQYLTTVQIGWLGALPPLALITTMTLWSRHSDLTNERHWHFTIGASVCAIGIIMLINAHTLAMTVGGMSLAFLGMGGTTPILWAHFNKGLGTAESAVGLAMINSIGNLGGFVGPYLMGAFKDATGGYVGGMWVFLVLLVLIIFIMQPSFMGAARASRVGSGGKSGDLPN